jgi:hypothetical protein
MTQKVIKASNIPTVTSSITQVVEAVPVVTTLVSLEADTYSLGDPPYGDQEYINIGTTPNDGLGDPLRTAFSKINNNFSNLFLTTVNTSSANTTGLTANQVIYTYPANAFTQGVFQIRSSNSANSQSITISAQIGNSNTSVKFTGYGLTIAGNAVTNYNMDVNSGNVRILVSPIANANITHFVASQVTYNGVV